MGICRRNKRRLFGACHLGENEAHQRESLNLTKVGISEQTIRLPFKIKEVDFVIGWAKVRAQQEGDTFSFLCSNPEVRSQGHWILSMKPT